MSDEVICLCGTRRVARLREVVGAADEAGVGRARVVGAEGGIAVGGAFGGFDVDEAEAACVVCGGEVDAGLPVGDVEALDCGLGCGD